MDFSFTVYEPKRGRAKRVEPIAEVTTNGRIVFNRMAKDLLQGKPYSILAVDKANKAVGVLSADSKDANTSPSGTRPRELTSGRRNFLKTSA